MGPQIADGGQGAVYELAGTPSNVMKRYHNPDDAQFDGQALQLMVAERNSVRHQGKAVDEFAAWPKAVVVDGAKPIGFVMQRVVKAFTLEIAGRVRLADMSYLAAEPRPMWGPVSLPPLEDKLQILRDLAGIVSSLHASGTVLGDISFANVLWAGSGRNQVLLLDCDGMQFKGRSSVLPQADTIDWNDPQASPGAPPTMDQDRYKLALAILRVLTRSLDARPAVRGLDVSGLGHLGAPVSGMMARAAGPAGTRPTAAEWQAALSDRATQPVLPAGPRRALDAPEAKPEMLGVTPRTFVPVKPTLP
ncbi:hypothetical protein [Nocardioides sediminis]|uniref:hypothetical protein n=1 Tax=Nocardioides sediminis TaxID=433648 RepID=UPI00131EF759|nr:hypothetical protein [Nocardioides sediminis]